MSAYNIIGDIAGEYDALGSLLFSLLSTSKTILVGDLNDRGPDSKKVIEWAMETDVITLNSNHGHMFVDFYRSFTDSAYKARYDWQDFFWNGGGHTLRSYGIGDASVMDDSYADYLKTSVKNNIPVSHIEWLDSRPNYFWDMEIGLFVSHAPLYSKYDDPEQGCLSKEWGWPELDRSLLWNRSEPVNRGTIKLQVFGHNSQWGVRYFGAPERPWAICIDDSRQKKLTAIHVAQNSSGDLDLDVIQAPHQPKTEFEKRQEAVPNV